MKSQASSLGGEGGREGREDVSLSCLQSRVSLVGSE